ncbi:MAG: hypothetical protein ACMXYG_03620 [Candidatus Woesearchaeota archaeon]
MLKKILSMFSKPKEVEIRLSDLKKKSEELFDNHINNTVIPGLKEKLEQIRSEMSIIKDKTKQLEVAKLKNQNIPLKEKQYMTGNRESYIKHVEILLKQMELPDDYTKIKSKYDNFKVIIEEFGKQTLRPRQILKHFFEHETESVHSEVGRLKKFYEQLNDLVNSKDYVAHVDLIENINKMINSKVIKEDLKKQIKEKEKENDNKNKEIKKTEKQLEDLRNSDEYSKYQTMIKEKESIKEHIAKIRSDIISKFSRIERAMRKYERIAFNDVDVIKEYLHDPFIAIENDQGKSSEMFKNLIKSIDKLDLKNKDKVLDTIITMNEDNFVDKTKDDIISSKKNLENINIEINKSSVLEEEGNLSEKITLDKKALIESKKSVEEIKENLDKITNESFIEKIRNNLSIILDAEVKIV